MIKLKSAPQGGCKGVPTGRAELEKRVAAGDACATSALVEKLISGRPSPADYERALALDLAVQAAGLRAHCWLIELGDDRAAYAKCIETGGNDSQFALLLAYGDGIAKDVQRARAIAGKLNDDCDKTGLDAQIETASKLGSGRAPDYCKSVACTTLSMNECVSEETYIARYTASFERKRVLDAMSASERQRFAQVEQSFMAYQEQESSRVYWMHINGSMRHLLSNGREMTLDDHVDDVARRVVDGDPIDPADDAAVEGLERDISKAERTALADGIPGPVVDASWQDSYRKAVRQSAARYRVFESDVMAFAGHRSDAVRLRALRAFLRRERIRGLRDEH